MKTLLLTNEYPPNVYGGAGIHVQYLSRELAKLCQVEVRCFGEQRIEEGNPIVHGAGWNRSNYTAPEKFDTIFGALQRGVLFNTRDIEANIVHLHTWYAHFGGILAKQMYGIPMVLTVHSLEPLRPWKRDQLGGGYDFTVWLEKTAIEMADKIIAVSNETRNDILRLFDVPEEKVQIIRNGIDPDEYVPCEKDRPLLKFHGISRKAPYVFFVGRITRQKGIMHLVNAFKHFDPGINLVIHANSADTPEMAKEMQEAIFQARKDKAEKIIWISELDTPSKIKLYANAAVFCCPSIYEPFGIINLEAMACETPVVASKVGGIKGVVNDGETGLLIPVEQHAESPYEPIDPEEFSRDLAAGINELVADPDRRERMGKAGRQRVLDHFSWAEIARETHELYQQVIDGSQR